MTEKETQETITQELLHELFTLREDGELVWKVSTARRVKIGDIAGTIHRSTGYRRITVNGKQYRAHRLIWFMVHGKFPVNMLDHINGNKLDNRISNLREATHQENMQNKTKADSDSKTGFLGVYLHQKKFLARIQVSKGRRKYLGRFDTPEEAHEAYLKAKREHHKFCTI